MPSAINSYTTLLPIAYLYIGTGLREAADLILDLSNHPRHRQNTPLHCMFLAIMMPMWQYNLQWDLSTNVLNSSTLLYIATSSLPSLPYLV